MRKTLTIFLIALLLFGCRSAPGSKTKVINETEIKQIFSSKVFMFLSIGDSNNNYHTHLHMFTDKNGKPFFPMYTSREKIQQTNMLMPKELPFDGIIFAVASVDEMTYKINYSLPDEIVITGKQIKEILHTELENFKRNNPEIMEGIILEK